MKREGEWLRTVRRREKDPDVPEGEEVIGIIRHTHPLRQYGVYHFPRIRPALSEGVGEKNMESHSEKWTNP